VAGLVLGAAIVDVITALAVALGVLNAKHVELALDITITIRPPGARRVVDRSASPRYLPRVSLVRTLPAGFIAPCLPMTAPRPPSGPLWLHEVKHDGFRVIACKDGDRVRLYSRQGNDLSNRFPRIVETMRSFHPAPSMARRSHATTVGFRHSTCFCIASETTMCISLPSI